MVMTVAGDLGRSTQASGQPGTELKKVSNLYLVEILSEREKE